MVAIEQEKCVGCDEWKGANLGLCGSTTTRSCKAAKSKAGAKVKAAPKAKTRAIMGKAIKIERYKLFLETVARIEELNALQRH